MRKRGISIAKNYCIKVTEVKTYNIVIGAGRHTAFPKYKTNSEKLLSLHVNITPGIYIPKFFAGRVYCGKVG